uniref:Synapse associated protein 1 n=1 Tax=Latimeria chalumnae TaxID=7897 RepID=H2ZW26_LATCH
MLRGFGSWLGIESPVSQSAEGEEKGKEDDAKPDPEAEINTTQRGESREEEAADPAQELLSQAKGIGSYLFSFATTATKKITESVSETAQTLKKSVEVGNIDGIIDKKTIIGDFQKEQDKFVQEKQTKKTGTVGIKSLDYLPALCIQEKFLIMGYKKKSCLKQNPPTLFFFFFFRGCNELCLKNSLELHLLSVSVSSYMDKKKKIGWGNYFWGGGLLKGLATAREENRAHHWAERHSTKQTLSLSETMRPKTPPAAIKKPLKPQEEEEEISTSPGVSEFVSDSFDTCNLNQDDLRKEIEQLVLDKKEEVATEEEESADWEKELQQELQDYEVVTEKRDENWDKEIEEMLQAED